MTTYDGYEPGTEGPVMEKCPADDCGHTEDLWIMVCAPGHTWSYVNGCGHWGFLYRKTSEG